MAYIRARLGCDHRNSARYHRQLQCYRSEPEVMKEGNTHVCNTDMKSKFGTIDNKKRYLVIPSVDMIIGVL